MTADAESRVVGHLRSVLPSQDETEADVGDLELRVSAIDRNFDQIQVQLGALNRSMDRFHERLTGVERRLERLEA